MAGSVTRMIDLARQGDADAKLQLWLRYRKLLYAMARDGSDDDQRSGAADTSDVVAEAGRRYFSADLLDHIRDRKHFQNWLRQLVHGKRTDQARRETARPTVPHGRSSGTSPLPPRTAVSPSCTGPSIPSIVWSPSRCRTGTAA
jgi:hypothetical protein